MNKKIEEKLYRTSSLPLATHLSLRQPIINVDKENPRKALFIFENTTEILNYVSEYWAGEARVEPQAYFNQLKILKGRLYESN